MKANGLKSLKTFETPAALESGRIMHDSIVGSGVAQLPTAHGFDCFLTEKAFAEVDFDFILATIGRVDMIGILGADVVGHGDAAGEGANAVRPGIF